MRIPGFIIASVLFAATLSSFCHSAGIDIFAGPQRVYAEEDWKSEFADICSKTEDAATLTAGELKNLIDRCERLKPLIEKLDETQRKIYLRRLQQCRDLLAFMLESKEKK